MCSALPNEFLRRQGFHFRLYSTAKFEIVVTAMTSPEERRLVAECHSQIQRARAINRLLETKDLTIEETDRLRAEARAAEAKYQATENALQAFRKANRPRQLAVGGWGA